MGDFQNSVTYIDLVQYSVVLQKAAMALDFIMLNGKNEGKGIECSITHTITKQNKLPCHKYAMIMYLYYVFQYDSFTLAF